MSSKRILSVGLVCLDVVHVVKSFPLEDTDQRSLDQYNSRGGNASNSCTVLKELGETCEYFGTLANNTLELAAIEKDFRDHGINYEHCPRYEDCLCPNSCVIVNATTASRTIIHTNKNLPELSPEHLDLVNLDNYDWIHFEGRNLENVKRMISIVKERKPDLPVSVEVEKIGRNFEDLIPLGDIVLVSKDVAKDHGAKDMLEGLDIFKPRLKKEAKLVIAWGDQGAAGLDIDGRVFSSPAFPPEGGVVDTLGAGDAFNAALLGTLRRGESLEKAIKVGCQVAGAKVGRRGFKGLGKVYQSCK